MAMNANAGGGIQSEINVTPLVDVVLVLLIIFMVMAPQMRKGPDVNLPDTAKPTDQGDERGRILVTVDERGALWIDDQEVKAADLGAAVAKALGGRPKEKRVLFLAAEDGLNYEGVLRIVDMAKTDLDNVTIEVITAN